VVMFCVSGKRVSHFAIEVDNLARLAYHDLTGALMLEMCHRILKMHLPDKYIGQDYDYDEAHLPLCVVVKESEL
jgi:hypothetical protein